MVNVPQAVWIDETGHIVRPTESAGAYRGIPVHGSHDPDGAR